jgi:periplasmic copper chaperone A
MSPVARLLAGLLLCLAASAQDGAAVQVRDSWVRWLPGNLPAGGYLTLTNNADIPIKLIGAACDAYGSVSLHQSRLQGGTVEMSPVEAITVKPHSSLNFATGGYHLMLMQPNRPLKPGDRIVITLKFARLAPIAVQFELLAPNASGPRG